MSRSNLVERQSLRNRCEQFPHVLRRLGRRLEEEEPRFLCICLGIRRRNGSFVRLLCNQIQLVSCESDDYVLVGLALKFLYPRLRLVE